MLEKVERRSNLFFQFEKGASFAPFLFGATLDVGEG
jgi:hypothetical protein